MNISIEILDNVINIIKASHDRSCWKIEELSYIGKIHDTLVEIIKINKEKIKEEEENSTLTTSVKLNDNKQEESDEKDIEQ